MTDQPAKHAHQHRRLGPDPINGLDGGWPVHQMMSLPAIHDLGQISGTHTLTTDANVFTNHKLQLNAQNAYFGLMFVAGPRYSRHQLIHTHNHGPDFGVMTFYLASLSADVAVSEGYNNRRELIAGISGAVQPEPNWVQWSTHNCYNATLTRNHTAGLHFRVEGDVGQPLTAIGTDSDSFASCDGGPGLYGVQIKMATKDAASSGYKCEVCEIGAHRIDESGFF